MANLKDELKPLANARRVTSGALQELSKQFLAGNSTGAAKTMLTAPVKMLGATAQDLVSNSQGQMFPRTQGRVADTKQQVSNAIAGGEVAKAVGLGGRGALATLVAMPADIVEAAGDAASPITDAISDASSACFLGANPTTTPPTLIPGKTVSEGEVLPSVQSPVQSPVQPQSTEAMLQTLLQPTQKPALPAIPSFYAGPSPQAPEAVTTVTQPTDFERSGAVLPQLPANPTMGDLTAFRLANLNAGAQLIPHAAQRKAATLERTEARADDALGLERFKLTQQTRQADRTLAADQIKRFQTQVNADRTADQSERRLRLGVLKATQGNKSSLEDNLKELQARREYLTDFWQYGDELGEFAFDLSAESDVPMEMLQDILTQEFERAGEVNLESATNIAKIKEQLRKRAYETR